MAWTCRSPTKRPISFSEGFVELQSVQITFLEVLQGTIHPEYFFEAFVVLQSVQIFLLGPLLESVPF